MFFSQYFSFPLSISFHYSFTYGRYCVILMLMLLWTTHLNIRYNFDFISFRLRIFYFHSGIQQWLLQTIHSKHTPVFCDFQLQVSSYNALTNLNTRIYIDSCMDLTYQKLRVMFYLVIHNMEKITWWWNSFVCNRFKKTRTEFILVLKIIQSFKMLKCSTL